jgi:hypothetical protein
MSTTYPPKRESLLVPWSGVFGTKISAAPTSVGLSAGQATAYGVTRAAFYAAWLLCQDAATKSKGNVALKNAKKTDLVNEIRELGRIIQAFPGTTNAMRVDLGLPERDLEPTPVPVPALAPSVEVKKVYGRYVTVTITDPTGERRGKMQGCEGAQLFTFVGENAPAGADGWKSEGVITRSKVIIAFAATVEPGSKVWITAAYFNPRGLTGPASTPISTGIGYEGALPLAA